MSDTVRPPAGDPKRQATDTYRGFLYQAWQAADAWLRLGANDVLFLEHAEDYDVVMQGGQVESVQVKGESGELSLGRAQARDAIGQYWDLRERNPGRGVSYRYLTTRDRGFERKRPFGERRGLDLWDAARRSDDDLRQLRTYLSEQDLPDGVLDLLRTGTDADVRERLVLPIHWDTEAPDADAVKRLVEERLVTYGDARALPVPPSVSRRVAPAVFLRITERSAAASARELTRADFAELFEQETTEPVPVGTPAAAAARAARSSSVPAQAGDPGFLELVSGTHLPVSLDRPELAELVRDRVRRHPLSAIVGSSGVGKTVLAEQAAADGGWYRVDLRGLSPDRAASFIDRTSLALSDLPDGATVILDDLVAGTGAGRIETAMGRLLTAARQQAIHVVVTTPSSLPSRIVLLSESAGEDIELSVPLLDEAEVGTLAERYGCPPALVPVWARVLWLQTSGHPQLVAALAADARGRQWPEPKMDDVVGTPQPVARVKAEALQTLVAALGGNERAFDLVRRLSVLSLPFTRAQALRLAQDPPPLPLAAADLEALIGPWVEPVGATRYRVSPLLAGLHRDVAPGSDTNLHAAAADALAQEAITSGSLDVYTLSMMLSQSVLGGNGRAMAFAATVAKGASDFARLADYLDWLPSIATGDAIQPMIASSPAASLVARELQFKVAVELGRDVEPVLEAWEAEIDGIEEAGGGVAGLHRLLAMSVLFEERATLATHRLVRTAELALRAVEAPDGDVEAVLDAAVRERGTTDEALLQALEANIRGFATEDLTPRFVFTVLGRRAATGSGVAAFVEAAVGAEGRLGAIARAAFAGDVAMTEAVASAVWTRSQDAGLEDWASVLGALADLSDRAERYGLEALAVSAERTRAVVLYEEIGDRQAAEEALDEAAARLGDSPRLREYRGKIMRMSREFPEALAFYEALLPGWVEEDPNTSRLYAYHDVIEAAGIVGSWDRASYWAGEAKREAARLSDASDSFVELCYAVDGAFATLKAGRPCDALAGLWPYAA